jgi:hypothetical protein
LAIPVKVPKDYEPDPAVYGQVRCIEWMGVLFVEWWNRICVWFFF